MDGPHFDDLARAIARRSSRRLILRLLGGGLAGIWAGHGGMPGSAGAPAAPAPPGVLIPLGVPALADTCSTASDCPIACQTCARIIGGGPDHHCVDACPMCKICNPATGNCDPKVRNLDRCEECRSPVDLASLHARGACVPQCDPALCIVQTCCSPERVCNDGKTCCKTGACRGQTCLQPGETCCNSTTPCAKGRICCGDTCLRLTQQCCAKETPCDKDKTCRGATCREADGIQLCRGAECCPPTGSCYR